MSAAAVLRTLPLRLGTNNGRITQSGYPTDDRPHDSAQAKTAGPVRHHPSMAHPRTTGRKPAPVAGFDRHVAPAQPLLCTGSQNLVGGLLGAEELRRALGTAVRPRELGVRADAARRPRRDPPQLEVDADAAVDPQRRARRRPRRRARSSPQTAAGTAAGTARSAPDRPARRARGARRAARAGSPAGGRRSSRARAVPRPDAAGNPAARSRGRRPARARNLPASGDPSRHPSWLPLEPRAPRDREFQSPDGPRLWSSADARSDRSGHAKRRTDCHRHSHPSGPSAPRIICPATGCSTGSSSRPRIEGCTSPTRTAGGASWTTRGSPGWWPRPPSGSRRSAPVTRDRSRSRSPPARSSWPRSSAAWSPATRRAR